MLCFTQHHPFLVLFFEDGKFKVSRPDETTEGARDTIQALHSVTTMRSSCLLSCVLGVFLGLEFATAWSAAQSSWSSGSVAHHTSTVLWASGSDRNPSRTDSQAPSYQGRKKKNKYANFSKTSTDIDPLEAMIAESAVKVQEIDEEKLRKKQAANPKPKIQPAPKVEFPDNKNIDPYDPSTFGYVEVGIVTGAHGVHGWIKVKSTTDFPKERLCEAGSIRHLKLPSKRAPRQVTLLQGRPAHQDEYLLQLDDINDRDTAQRLRGSVLYAREEDKVTPQEEEYLVSDMIGLEVFLDQEADGYDSETGSELFVGTIGGIVLAEDFCSIPGLGHDMLEIVIPRGIGGTSSLLDELVLIPMVPQIVSRVDVPGGAVYIDPPTGLLDLTYVRDEKVRIKGFLPPAKE